MKNLAYTVRAEEEKLTQQAARDLLLDAAVDWYHGWANTPTLHLLFARADQRDNYSLPAPFTHDHDNVYLPFVDGVLTEDPYGRGTVWIHRRAPHVKFFFEQKRPEGVEGAGNADRCGAVGRTLTKPNGERYTSYGGWTSNAGAINRLRNDHPDIVAHLPEQIMEVTYHISEWNNLGMAGTAWDLSFVKEAVAKYLPGVVLLPQDLPSDTQASASQSQAALAGMVRPEDLATTWLPYPETTPYEKPDKEGTFVYETSYQSKRGRVKSWR